LPRTARTRSHPAGLRCRTGRRRRARQSRSVRWPHRESPCHFRDTSRHGAPIRAAKAWSPAPTSPPGPRHAAPADRVAVGLDQAPGEAVRVDVHARHQAGARHGRRRLRPAGGVRVPRPVPLAPGDPRRDRAVPPRFVGLGARRSRAAARRSWARAASQAARIPAAVRRLEWASRCDQPAATSSAREPSVDPWTNHSRSPTCAAAAQAASPGRPPLAGGATTPAIENHRTRGARLPAQGAQVTDAEDPTPTGRVSGGFPVSVYQRAVRVPTPSSRLACPVPTPSDAPVPVTTPTVPDRRPLSTDHLNCSNPHPADRRRLFCQSGSSPMTMTGSPAACGLARRVASLQT
jgi:hypothetical protein